MIKVKLSITTLLLCLLCFFSTIVLAQGTLTVESPPKYIRLGIRTAAFSIGSFNATTNQYGGFCKYFLDELENELSRQNLQTVVTPQVIANQHRGKSYPRFDGLLKNIIDIECGPNSTSSLDLKIKEGENDILKEKYELFGDRIKLSKKIFHTTGIKLIIKKEIANELNKDSKNLENKLRGLSIAVLRQTTTLNEFEKNRQYYRSYIPYPKIEQPNSKLDVRDLALDDLENDRVQAFASDTPMLQTLFDKGVEGESQFTKNRSPYKENSDYTIFPAEQGKYLPHLSRQSYAIAITKDTNYSKWLISTIDNVLNSDAIKIAGDKIERYESIEDASSSEKTIKDSSNVKKDTLEGKDKDKDKDNGNNSVQIIVAVITAIATLGAAYASRKK